MEKYSLVDDKSEVLRNWWMDMLMDIERIDNIIKEIYGNSYIYVSNRKLKNRGMEFTFRIQPDPDRKGD